ncbi:MAG: gfo/Idh/MocA family oxidoreductase [Pseudomonadales bacterium]|nr:gfo/Idh/MocA family oxidoreductase [Pseudomonadales bacterium]
MKNEKSNNKTKSQLNRRDFIKKSAIASSLLIVPRHVLGGSAHVAPSDKVNIAGVGAGGRGRSNIQACAHENIYALCDMDDSQVSQTLGENWAAPFNGKAKVYRDYREMLENEPELDALIISTPDHMHTPIAAAAMDLGKHLYIEKPLCHTVAEARFLARRARETNIVSQMGNQGHAQEGGRLINEWVADGVLGTVQEVHCWTNRPVWPQGIARPAGSDPIPSTIDWDLWLGAAPHRPYLSDRYHRFNWRGWLDFGTGVVGDMGAHIIDHPYWALDLDLPTKVSASSSRFGADFETFPIASKIHFEFPAKGSRPAVKLTWYDGGLLPERPEILEQGRMLGDRDGGVLIVGDKNTLMHGVYGREPRLIPETKHLEYQQPAPTMARSPGIHQEWIDAIKDRSKMTTSHFEYSGQLSETMLLGNIATVRASENKDLEYDGANMRFTNDEGAKAHLDKDYRAGFGLV